QAERALALAAQRPHDLVEREDQVDVVRLATETARQGGQHLSPPRPLEVRLCVELVQAGVPRHARNLARSAHDRALAGAERAVMAGAAERLALRQRQRPVAQ